MKRFRWPQARPGLTQLARDLGRVIRLVWRAHPAYATLVAMCTVLQGLLPAAQMWMAKLLIDRIAFLLSTQGGPTASDFLDRDLGMIVLVQAILVLLGALLSNVQVSVNTLLGERLSNDISHRILMKTSGLDVSFFDEPDFHNQLSEAYQQASYRPLTIVSQLFTSAQIVIGFVSSLLILMRLNGWVIPVLVVAAVPSLLIQIQYGELNYWMMRGRIPDSRLQQYFGSLMTNDRFVREIRLYQLEDHFTRRHQTLFERFFTESRRHLAGRSKATAWASVASAAGWLISIGYLVAFGIRAPLSIGDFTLYSQAVSAAQAQLQQFLAAVANLYSDLLFVRSLFAFLTLPESRALSSGLNWSEPLHQIEFRHVSFTYPNAEKPAVTDVSFVIRQGESLALVGRNGAGKSTLIKLLSGLYRPTSGAIFLNGKDAAEYSARSIQDHVATLFQDFGCYCLTAHENISLGRISRPDGVSDVHSAARRAGAYALIAQLPDGFDTRLGKWFEHGVELSGGEWQRIALARTFFRQGDLVVLDEPTSALDAEAELDVFQQLLNEMPDKITILVSHRFSTVRVAKRILVLAAGACIEYGTHEELLKAQGLYADLYHSQSQGFAVTYSDGWMEG